MSTTWRSLWHLLLPITHGHGSTGDSDMAASLTFWRQFSHEQPQWLVVVQWMSARGAWRRLVLLSSKYYEDEKIAGLGNSGDALSYVDNWRLVIYSHVPHTTASVIYVFFPFRISSVMVRHRGYPASLKWTIPHRQSSQFLSPTSAWSRIQTHVKDRLEKPIDPRRSRTSPLSTTQIYLWLHATLIFWATRLTLTVSCFSLTDYFHLCQLASRSVHSFSKYRVDKVW